MASSGGGVGPHVIINIPEETFPNGEEQAPVWSERLWSWLWKDEQKKQQSMDLELKSHSFSDIKAEPARDSWTSQSPEDHTAPVPPAHDPVYPAVVPRPKGDLTSVASAQYHEVSRERDALKLELDKMKKINNELNQATSDLEMKCEGLTAEKAIMVFQVEELRQKVHQKNQEVHDLQQQREQCLSLQHRYAAAFQQLQVACHQLKFENYTLPEQFAMQGRIWYQPQPTDAQTKVSAEMTSLVMPQEHMVTLSVHSNQQVQAERSLQDQPGQGGQDQAKESHSGDGETIELMIIDDQGSGDTVVEQKINEARVLEEQLHQCLTHLQHNEGYHQQLRAAYVHLCCEHEALHRQLVQQSQDVVMLQHTESRAKMAIQTLEQELQQAQNRIGILEEYVKELKDQVDAVFRRCVLLAADPYSNGNGIALSERASMEALLQQKEARIKEVSQENEQMEIKLSELLSRQQKKENQPTPRPPGPQDVITSDQHDHQEVSLEDNVEPEQTEATEASPHEKPTAQPMEHLHAMRCGKQQQQDLVAKPNHLEGGKELEREGEQETTQSDLNIFEDSGSQGAMMVQKSQGAQCVQRQRDQCLPHLQHSAAPHQQVHSACTQQASDKEALNKQLHGQPVEQRQHDKAQAQSAADMAPMQEHLKGIAQENLPRQIHTGQACRSSCDRPCIPFFYKDNNFITI